MSQNPPWPPQGQGSPQDPRGYPQQPPQGGGYPPQGGRPGNPQQGYPQQGYPQGGQSGQGPYQPQGYAGPFQGQPQGGYPPQGQGGYQPPPSTGGPAGPAGPSPRKSTGLILGIVVAAVVLLVAVGGIIMALSGGDDEPVSTITPAPQPTPTGDPSTQPTTEPSPQPTEPSNAPSTNQPSGNPTQAPSGDTVDLGNGVKLTPAPDWQVRSEKGGAAQLVNGRDIFVGIVAKLPADSNASQTCDAYHRDIGKEYTNSKFADPKKVDLGTKKLSGATCSAQVTVANGGNAIQVYIFSLVSIRTDGLAVVGSLYFTEDSDTASLDKDFTAMVNSMLKGQSAGG